MAEIVLTEEQRAVLKHDRDRPARVLAGPGAGKSATLVALIGEMVKEKPAPRVRLLTFTRAATAELANKLEDRSTFGARGGIRTHTPRGASAFKAPSSASSDTRAGMPTATLPQPGRPGAADAHFTEILIDSM